MIPSSLENPMPSQRIYGMIASWIARAVTVVGAVLGNVAFAQEPGQLSAPVTPPTGTLHQCQLSFSKEWRAGSAKRQAQIDAANDALRDLQEAKRNLVNDRIFRGLGPPASSEEARILAKILNNVIVAGKLAGAVVESASPGSARSGVLAAYEFFKKGNRIRDYAQTKSPAEFAYKICKEWCGISRANKTLIGIGQQLTKGVLNEVAWKELKEEVDAALKAMDAQTQGYQQRLVAIEASVTKEAESAFIKYCSELREPIAVDDGPYNLKSGIIGEFNVLENDTDPDGGSLRVVSVQTLDPSQGTVAIYYQTDRRGTVRFRPSESFSLPVQIRYTVVDSQGQAASGRINVYPSSRLSSELDGVIAEQEALSVKKSGDAARDRAQQTAAALKERTERNAARTARPIGEDRLSGIADSSIDQGGGGDQDCPGVEVKQHAIAADIQRRTAAAANSMCRSSRLLEEMYRRVDALYASCPQTGNVKAARNEIRQLLTGARENVENTCAN
jgi:hypothetical protein